MTIVPLSGDGFRLWLTGPQAVHAISNSTKCWWTLSLSTYPDIVAEHRQKFWLSLDPEMTIDPEKRQMTTRAGECDKGRCV